VLFGQVRAGQGDNLVDSGLGVAPFASDGLAPS